MSECIDRSNVKRVSWQAVKEYNFDGLVIEAVGEKYLSEDKQKYVGAFHCIAPSGMLVCQCVPTPVDHIVMEVGDTKPSDRWAFCPSSKSYLRSKVTTHIASRNQT